MVTRRSALLCGLSAAFSTPAISESFPARPVRLVVPYTVGGTSDLFARQLAVSVERRWGQPLLVDPRPGAGTVIGTALVAKAQPDGYTLGIIASSFLINAKLRKNLPYDSMRAFAPVAGLFESPQVLAVASSKPYRTLADWVADARQRGAAVSIGAVGPGTGQHIAIEMLKRATQLKPTYVPFGGGAAAVTAALGGHVDAILQNFSEVGPNIEAGRLRPLAVLTMQRIEQLKDVPTFAESGYPGFEHSAWFGVVAPVGTPPAIVSKLADDFGLALQEPALLDGLRKLGLRPTFMGPAATASYLSRKYEEYSRVIDDARITIDS